MPRYHPLDTGIKLCIWDPQSPPALEQIPKKIPKAKSGASSASSKLKGAALISKQKKVERSDPAAGRALENLREEYFEGYEGVHFLAPASPFYLVKAGSDLFVSENDKAEQAALAVVSMNDGISMQNEPATSSPLSDPNTSPSTMKAALLAPQRDSGGISDPKSHTKATPDKLIRSAVSNSQLSKRSKKGVVDKPITSPKPLAVVVDLSQKSFMPSLNTKLRQEVCVNIFYNGELTHSRILRANTYSSLTGPVYDERLQYYSGRRIDTFLEVPWVIQPIMEDGVSQKKQVEALGFEQRWVQVNQFLATDADSWGHYGRYRSPMGEYLEDLSQQKVPDSAKDFRGDNAGIIDVVIVIGRTVGGPVAGLREPRRKVHEDRCGLGGQLVSVPEELRPDAKAKIVAQFDRETAERDQSVASDPIMTENTKDSGNKPAFRPNQAQASSRKLPPNISTDKSGDGPSEMFPSWVSGISNISPLMPSSKGFETRSMLRQSSLPMPKKPPNIAQKRYKGSTPDIEALPKKSKLVHEIAKLATGLNPQMIAPSRTRRAVSSPVASSREKISNQSLNESSQGGEHRHTSINLPRFLRLPKAVESLAHNANNNSDDTKGKIGPRKIQKGDGNPWHALGVATKVPHPPTDTQDLAHEVKHSDAETIMTAVSPSPKSRMPRPRPSFGLDGTSEDLNPHSKGQSSTTRGRPRPSLPMSDEDDPMLGTPASSTTPRRSDQSQSPSGKIATRISLTAKGEKVAGKASDVEANQPSSETSSFTWTQTNKFVTANHPSVKAKRRRAKKAAEAERRNAGSSTDAGTSSQASSSMTPLAKSKCKSDMSDRPTKASTPMAVLSGGAEITEIAAAEASAHVHKQRKLSHTTSSAKKISSAAMAKSASPGLLPVPIKNSMPSSIEVEMATKESKLNSPTSRSKPSQNASNPKSELGGDKSGARKGALSKSQTNRKRDSVSSRELKELLEPHKPVLGVDISFGTSFKEEAQKVRASRASAPSIQLQEPKIARRGLTATPATMTSTKSKTLMARQEFAGKPEEPILLNLMMKPAGSITVDKSASLTPEQADDLQQDRDRTSSNSSFEDFMATQAGLKTFAKVVRSTLSTINEQQVVLGVAKPHQLQDASNGVADKSSRPLPDGILMNRNFRSYSTDAEGKKVPSPKEKSSLGAISISQSQPVPRPERLKPASSGPRKAIAGADTLFGRTQTQKLSTKPELPRTKLPDISPPARGKSESAYTRPQTQKVTVSETDMLSTPGRAYPRKTPTSQTTPVSVAKNKKRKAGDMSDGWNPTALCESSTLGYASEESWPGVRFDTSYGGVVRNIKSEREGVFRANGILMGVRFVVGVY